MARHRPSYSENGTAVAPEGTWLPPNHPAQYRWTVAAIALALSIGADSIPVCESSATGGPHGCRVAGNASAACGRLSSAMRDIKASRCMLSQDSKLRPCSKRITNIRARNSSPF